MSQEIPVLTLHQPWAQLIVAGRKRIETRSWKHSYRGPIAVHASLTKADFTDPVYEHCSTTGMLHDDIRPLTFGAVVAVAELVDIVPMIGNDDHGDGRFLRIEQRTNGETELWIYNHDNGICHPATEQLPYGDFRPGRYAWLLNDVRPIAPVPFKGGQGLSRRVALDLLAVPA